MKRSAHILLSLLLAVTLLYIGSGITIMRCAHTGTVKVMTAIGSTSMGAMDDMGCDMTSKCMSVTHIELSPTVTVQQVTYDFHAVQPLLAILPSLVAGWMQPTASQAVVQPVREVWKSPPRDYLNFIQVLLI